MAAGTVLSTAKDIYILKLGASVAGMSAVSTILAVWGPVASPLVGYMLDKDLLVRWFPWEKWGRRAPWYFTHLVLTAILTGVVFLPPSFNSLGLCIWFFFIGVLGIWVLTVDWNCLESARAEIFPTKEQRSQSEASVKIFVGVGMGIGVCTQLFILDQGTVLSMHVSSIVIFIVSLISLVSVPLLRLARVKYDSSCVRFPWAETLSVLRIPAMRHFFFYRFMEGLVNNLLYANMLYHLTFVERLWGHHRSSAIFVGGLIVGITSSIMLPVWTQFFRFRRRVNTNVVCASATALGLLASPILAFLQTVTSPPTGFFVYIGWVNLSLTMQSFWRVCVFGWLVDEDSLTEDNRRRESIFHGSGSFFSAIGAAVSVGIMFIPLALLGLQVKNCGVHCQGDSEAVDMTACLEACDRQNVSEQPDGVAFFIQAINYVIMPFFELVLAICMFTFPIYGERLERLCAAMAAVAAAVASEKEASTALTGTEDTPLSQKPVDRCRDVATAPSSEPFVSPQSVGKRSCDASEECLFLERACVAAAVEPCENHSEVVCNVTHADYLCEEDSDTVTL
eukprot:TRINITY_DN50478_c0_g1_i1.p1 TRINITY_DN50478_c0_g1~~TRINITY_DN50478_c0_g1_i1.p1  ORF type:complete len:616 (+),score=61.46 TRINITY_DN50478_c0_g1_i1:159-1850(+)